MQFNIILFAIIIAITIPFIEVQGDVRADKELHSHLIQKLEGQIKKSKIKKKNLGLYIYHHDEQGDSHVLYAHNSEKKFIPASLTKLITAGAALYHFGPSYTVETALMSNGKRKGSQLDGDLILKGGGDPGFVSEKMWALVNKFTRTGISRINGNIIVDDTLFDDVRFDPGREDRRVDRAYDAPVSAMSFNWNSVNIFIRPGVVGKKALVHLDPPNGFVDLTNNVKTTSSKSATRVSASRVKARKTKDGIKPATLKAQGRIAKGSEEEVIYKNITFPSLWSGYNLKAFLRRRGIEVTGEVKRGKAPADAKDLASEESKPVSAMVSDLMKFSNNFVAEMLTKKMVVKLKKRQGNMKDGLKVLKEFVELAGIGKPNYVLDNPSGLSRENKFRPVDLHRLMAFAKNDFRIFAEYLSALPILGRDGTLKSRAKHSKARGWVRAKTGMLSGVQGLAGFAGRKDGSQLSFVFLFNGSGRNTFRARDLFDRLAETLAQ